ncbi:MAG: hypothetical protein WCW13_02610, partial [archaeon]
GAFSRQAVFGSGASAVTLNSTCGPDTYHTTPPDCPYDSFVAKYDSSGNLIWAKNFGNGLDDTAYSISVDSAGNIFVSGNFWGTITLGNTTLISAPSTTYTLYDLYVAKMDSSGNFIWATDSSGGSAYDSRMELGSLGDIYLLGHFNLGTLTLGSLSPLTTQILNGDIFVAKLHDNGSSASWVWAKQSSTTPTTSEGVEVDPYSIKFVAPNKIYVAGAFAGTTSFAPISLTSTAFPAQPNSHSLDPFVAKITDNGGTASWTWVEKISDASNGYSKSIDADSSGNVYLGGLVSGDATFGSISKPSRSSSGLGCFVAKLHDNGSSASWVWADRCITAWSIVDSIVYSSSSNRLFVGGTTTRGTLETTPINPYGDGITPAVFIANILADDGNVTKVFSPTGDCSSGVMSLALDSSDWLYVAGNYSYPVAYGSGTIYFWEKSLYTIQNKKTLFISKLFSKLLIPMNSGNPFFTSTQNAASASLNAGASTSITWPVNATGYIGYTDSFLVYAKQLGGSAYIESPIWPVKIVAIAADGVCGLANGKTYSAASTNFGADTFCLAGDVNATPSFPAQGTSVSWTCVGSNTGVRCSASRAVLFPCANESCSLQGEVGCLGNQTWTCDINTALNCLQKNYSNCGTNICPSDLGLTGVCSNTCSSSLCLPCVPDLTNGCACKAGYSDCDGNTLNGCEIFGSCRDTSATQCAMDSRVCASGFDLNVCTLVGIDNIWVKSSCGITNCVLPNMVGSCNNTCSGASCASCLPVCDCGVGYSDCNSDPGCETYGSCNDNGSGNGPDPVPRELNSIDEFNGGYDGNLNVSFNCLFTTDSNLVVFDYVSGEQLYRSNQTCSISKKNLVLQISNLVLNKLVKVVLEINQPCEVCSKERFVPITKTERANPIPDNNLFFILLTLVGVVFLIFKQKRN